MPNINISPAFARNNVPVVLASNNLFAPYTGVFIRSLLDHSSGENNYDIVILNREISEENQRLLKSLAADYTNVSIRFYDPSPFFASFHYVDDAHKWPLEIFYKIAAPHILKYPGRIIVVDIDTYLMTDIARLMDEDLAGYCVGGVSSAPRLYAEAWTDRITNWTAGKGVRARDRWGGTDDWKNIEAYDKNRLNGGLLVFDCGAYARQVDIETLLSTAQSTLSEETALLILAKESIKLLDIAWNVWVPVNDGVAEMYKYLPEAFNKIYNEDGAYERAVKKPCILHWMGRPKPWVCPDVPYGGEWWQTALRTPFIGHIIARMTDEQNKRRQYYRERYGAENVDVWDPSPKGFVRAGK